MRHRLHRECRRARLTRHRRPSDRGPVSRPPPWRDGCRREDRRRRGLAATDSRGAEASARSGAGDGVPARGFGTGRDRGRVRGRGNRDARLARGAGRRRSPRSGGAGQHAAHRAARAGAAPGADRSRDRVARLPRAQACGAQRRRVHHVALLPHGHLQGPLRSRPAGGVLSRPHEPRPRGPVRRSSTSASRPTRCRPGSARSRSGSSATTARSTRFEGNVNWMRAREGNFGSTDDELYRPVLDESGSDSAMLDNALELHRPRRPRRAPRRVDADPAGVGGRRGAPPRGAGLLPLPRRAARAVGRPCRRRLHGRARASAPPSTATACGPFATRSARTGSSSAPRRPAPSPLDGRRSGSSGQARARADDLASTRRAASRTTGRSRSGLPADVPTAPGSARDSSPARRARRSSRRRRT